MRRVAQRGGVVRCCSPRLAPTAAVARPQVRWLSLKELADAFGELSSAAPAAATRSSTVPVVPCGERTDIASPRPSHARRASSVLFFTDRYANHLATLPDTQLANVMETSCRQLHYSDIVQCLMELCRRLQQKECECVAGGAGAATRGGVEISRGGSLLEMSLRCSVKINVSQLTDELQSGVHACLSTRKGRAPSQANGLDVCAALGHSFSHQLSEQLLHWLGACVSDLDAHQCVTFTHLLVQQPLLACDAVLDTLIDNVLVACRRASEQVTSAARTDVTAIFSLNELAIMFDAILRCETSVNFARSRWCGARHQQSMAQRQRRKTAAAAATPTATAAQRSARAVKDLLAAVARAQRASSSARPACQRAPSQYASLSSRAGADAAPAESPTDTRADATSHPLLDARVYDALAAQLALHFQRPAAWTAISPTSFFFLTRALGKLQRFDPPLVDALLPGMADYLRAHPEQYLGVVLLLGRPENRVVDTAVGRVLIDVLVERLQRRQRALAATGAATTALRAERVVVKEVEEGAEEDVEDDAMSLAELEAADDASARANDDATLPLLSEEPTSLHAAADARPAAAGDAEDNATPPVPHRRASERWPTAGAAAAGKFTVSLVEIAAFPTFLSCLCHVYHLAEQQEQRQQQQLLRSRMETLCRLLLDDVHRGVPSLAALSRLPAPVLEKMLRALLDVCDVLSPTSGTAADATAAAAPLHRHALLVEVAYLWTQCVATGRIVVAQRHQQHHHHLYDVASSDPLDAEPGRSRELAGRLLNAGILKRVVLARRGATPASYSSVRAGVRGARDTATEVISAFPERAEVAQVPYYIIPFDEQQQRDAPRVYAAVLSAMAAREAQRHQRSRPYASAHDMANESSNSSRDNSQREASRGGGSKRQKLQLVMHFSRFSSAIGAE